jgi:hypothetical protein
MYSEIGATISRISREKRKQIQLFFLFSSPLTYVYYFSVVVIDVESWRMQFVSTSKTRRCHRTSGKVHELANEKNVNACEGVNVFVNW